MGFDGCYSGANWFIEKHFHDCVYGLRDYIGFCLGMTSILLWVIAQMPQFISNYKNKSAEALSPWFLAQWLLGDTCNLLGCLLQGEQLPTTTYTAMYFVVADVIMMMQYIYYGALQRSKERILKKKSKHRHHHHHHHHQHQHHSQRTTPDECSSSSSHAMPPQLLQAGFTASGKSFGSVSTSMAAALSVTALLCCSTAMMSWHVASSSRSSTSDDAGLQNISRHMAGSEMPAGMLHRNPDTDWVFVAGTTLGYISSVLYLMSRASQIIKTHKRKSAEGLSLAMFMCAVFANLCTGTGIILRTFTTEQLLQQIPWILGSLGTITLDMGILAQARYYGRQQHQQQEAQQPLLGGSDSEA